MCVEELVEANKEKQPFVMFYDTVLKWMVLPDGEKINVLSFNKGYLKCQIPATEFCTKVYPYIGYPVIETHKTNKEMYISYLTDLEPISEDTVLFMANTNSIKFSKGGCINYAK